MNETNSIHIGTSGWSYKHWREIFYPHNLNAKNYLQYYCEHFKTVEINNSFYHLLKEEIVQNWVKTVPSNFIFAVKANRYITHVKRLKEPEKRITNFIESIKSFEEKLGPILFQLPPKFGFNSERLESFIKILPQNYKYVFEFRDKSWFNPKTYDILRKNNIAFCIYSLGDYQSPKEITSDFAYIRFHGPGGLGSNKYNDEKLNEFCDEIMNFKRQGKDVFCYFNNDEAGYAVENAFELKEKLNFYVLQHYQ